MKIKLIKKQILSYLIIIILVVTIKPIFSWVAKSDFLDPQTTGSSLLNYFAQGTGSIDDPFILNHKKHVYHLAWLQNLGEFNDKKYYFALGANINMEGTVVPPIGTELYPFIGDFNGNYYTISNLYISNNKLEHKQYFDFSQVDLGTKVGFFGVIDSTSVPYNPDTAGKAYKFYLENTNISNSVNNSVIGIVVGHNNGHLIDIGVSNNSYKLTNGLISKSKYVLIGELGANTQWIGAPTDSGNKILIDPNDPADSFTALLPINGVQQYRVIKASVPERAYMTSTLNYTTAGPTGLYKIKESTISTLGNVETWTPNNTVLISNLDAAINNGIPTEFWNRYSTATSTTKYIMPDLNSYPTPTNTMNVPFENGYLTIPYNGIWFKPNGSGACGISFSAYNQSDDSAMAIYEYTRDSNGNITNWKETRFVLLKSMFNNKVIVYFDFDVKQGYEYVIGRSSVSQNTAGFFYLILLGVGYQGDGASSVQYIDYVMRDTLNQFPVISSQGYILNNTLLSYEGTSTSEGNIYFNKNTYNSITAVYHYSAVGSIVIMERATGTTVSSPAPQAGLDSIFYNWMNVYMNDP